MPIYTRRGDDGTSALFNGARVPKHHPRLQALGDIDELNSHLGLAAAVTTHADLKATLHNLQRQLLALGADIATPLGAPTEKNIRRIAPDDVAALEQLIDIYTKQLPPLNHFILPTGTPAAGHLHVARAVCRRAERSLSALLADPAQNLPPLPLIFVNRLSDLLFTLARFANHQDEMGELEWNV